VKDVEGIILGLYVASGRSSQHGVELTPLTASSQVEDTHHQPPGPKLH
jgi:hypothetical protein